MKRYTEIHDETQGAFAALGLIMNFRMYYEEKLLIAQFFRHKINFDPSFDTAAARDDNLVAHAVGGKAVAAAPGCIAGGLFR